MYLLFLILSGASILHVFIFLAMCVCVKGRLISELRLLYFLLHRLSVRVRCRCPALTTPNWGD